MLFYSSSTQNFFATSLCCAIITTGVLVTMDDDIETFLRVPIIKVIWVPPKVYSLIYSQKQNSFLNPFFFLFLKCKSKIKYYSFFEQKRGFPPPISQNQVQYQTDLHRSTPLRVKHYSITCQLINEVSTIAPPDDILGTK